MNLKAFSGNWISRFFSPAGNCHDCKLEVNTTNSPHAVKLSMEQTKWGETAPTTTVNFDTQAKVAENCLALLSSDPDHPGLNCIILKLSADASSMSGQIVWNSLSHKRLYHGDIEFKRSPDEE